MQQETAVSTGFEPIARHDARVLILGSLPSERSIRDGQYYAHPQNVFWPIMRELIGAEGAYEARCAALVEHGIALWDVLESSVRPGSMDADIHLNTARVNDFEWFFSAHGGITLICFNGKKAEQTFHKFVERQNMTLQPRLESLPSTSPAYASMPFAKKLEKWRSAINDIELEGQSP